MLTMKYKCNEIDHILKKLSFKTGIFSVTWNHIMNETTCKALEANLQQGKRWRKVRVRGLCGGHL